MTPLTLICGAWLLGILVGPHLVPSPVGYLLSAGGCLLLGAALVRHRAAAVAAVALGIFLLGAWRNPPASRQDPLADVSRHVGAGAVIVVGVIDEPPVARDAFTTVRVSAETVVLDGGEATAHGAVLVWTSRYCDCSLGDRVRLRGRLEQPEPYEGVDYPRVLAERGIRSIMRFPQVERVGHDEELRALAAVDGLRRRLAGGLSSALPEPQAALAAGLLLGQRADIPRDLLRDFNRTGTTHILAISGYNTSLVVVYLMALTTPLVGRRRAAALALAGVTFFCVLTGAAPSVVRATIMAGLAIGALLLGRQGSASLGLLMAAALMVGLQPGIVRDVGFQLSFAATAVLVALGPGVNRLLCTRLGPISSGRGAWLAIPAQSVLEATVLTLVISAVTLPLIAYHFRTAPLSGLIANPLLVPALGPALLGAALVATAGSVVPVLATILSALAWLPLSYIVLIVASAAELPLSAVLVPAVPSWALWLFFGGAWSGWWLAGNRGVLSGLRAGMAALRRRGAPAVPRRPLWILVTIAVLLWPVVLTGPDDDLHVYFLDVGQGDAIFIRGPTGKILVDGGPSPQRILSHLGRLMPFWDRRLDYLVLTHADADHLTGLVEVLERFQVRGVVEGSSRGSDPVYQRWEELSGRNGRQRLTAEAGLRLRLGDQAELTVVYAPDPSRARGVRNEESLVLRLSAPAVSVMLTGDLTADGQAVAAASGAAPQSTVLKVPHHGGRDSLNEAFLRRVAPGVSVISVGADNRFGHPAPSTLELLSGTQILRTDERGTIELVTDGRSYRLQSER